MRLFDQEINHIEQIWKAQLGRSERVAFFSADQNQSWPLLTREQLILRSDMEMELGESLSVSGLAFTTTPLAELTGRENSCGVAICGPDLTEIAENRQKNSNQTLPYVRFVLVQLKKDALEGKSNPQIYGLLRKLDFLRFHWYPDGFMLRISTAKEKEVVRVSKKAISEGISFHAVGQSLLKLFLEQPEVEAVQIYFLTDSQAMEAARELQKIATTCHGITASLDEIFNGLKMDCSTCAQKKICDEIDGMKELHQQSVLT